MSDITRLFYYSSEDSVQVLMFPGCTSYLLQQNIFLKQFKEEGFLFTHIGDYSQSCLGSYVAGTSDNWTYASHNEDADRNTCGCLASFAIFIHSPDSNLCDGTLNWGMYSSHILTV